MKKNIPSQNGSQKYLVGKLFFQQAELIQFLEKESKSDQLLTNLSQNDFGRNYCTKTTIFKMTI